MGLLTSRDMDFISDAICIAKESFFKEGSFSILINAFGFSAFDETVSKQLEQVCQELCEDLGINKVALLFHRDVAPCILLESVPLFTEKSTAVHWLVNL